MDIMTIRCSIYHICEYSNCAQRIVSTGILRGFLKSLSQSILFERMRMPGDGPDISALPLTQQPNLHYEQQLVDQLLILTNKVIQ